jgi:hypothetical protein
MRRAGAKAEGKRFFFEKKNQKTFSNEIRDITGLLPSAPGVIRSYHTASRGA